MPTGQPTVEQLWNGDISFFSIDTDLIQGAGYKFCEGALHQLPNLLPTTMKLQLTEVVAQEIIKHRLQPVTEAAKAISCSLNSVRRLAKIDTTCVETPFRDLSIETAATAKFRQEIEEFATRCRGSILPIDGDQLAERVFALYFDEIAPFAARRDKKSEFPDATSLLILEDHAESEQTKGLITSGDDGWSAYAESSDRLYCVRSIDELVALFAATDEHAQSVKKKVLAAISDDNSPLRELLAEEIQNHVSGSSWNVGEIYSGIVPRVEGEFYDATMTEYSLDESLTSAWVVEDDRSTWVVEVTARVLVTVQIDVAFYIWDSFDREEWKLTSELIAQEVEIEVQAFVSCAGVNSNTEPNEWDVEIEIASSSYDIDVGEVEPDMTE